MKKVLGDCPTPDQRETFKSFWCVNHSSLNSFKNIPRCNCFLCEYTKQAGVDCNKCPIDWGPKVGCINNDVDYRYTPISKILERPERAELKKGKWILVTNGRGGHECSRCHDYAPSYQNGNERLSNYCPTCGADMRDEYE